MGEEVVTNVVPSADLQHKIKRQVEYYFGDANLPRDKFLLEQVKENDGWIPLETMVKFKRLSALSCDFDTIASSLKDSTLLEVSEDKLKIRRNPSLEVPEFNEERKKELAVRTVYCKGFPKDDTKIESLLDYFHDEHGKVENIQMRKWYDKLDKEWKFKGSVFVLFPSEKLAEEFLKKDEVVYKDEKLIRKWLNDYLEEKRVERKKSKKSGTKDQAENDKNGDHADKENEESEAEEEAELLPKGATLHLTGMTLDSDLSREDLKAKILEGYGDIEFAFIDFSRGQQEAYIRLGNEELAPKVFEKLGAELEIKGNKLTMRVLEGEEEETYLKKALQDKSKRMGRNKMRGKGGQGRGRRGRRGRGGKRGGYGRGDNPRAKRVKTE